MFPDVTRKQWRSARKCQRVIGIAGADDFKLTLGIEDKPSPSRAKSVDGRFAELCFKLVN